MTTLHRILCPVDFSEPSKRALRYALALARWHESEIAVLHVDDLLIQAAAAGAVGYPPLAGGGYQELQDFIDDAGGESRNVQLHVATGRAVPSIVEHASRERSDLIVMGTNGRSGLARAVLGSVTEGVVRQAAMPVLTIPPAANASAVEELMPFDSVLCATDFSAACKRALALAIVMGQEADARLIVLHAFQERDPGVTSMPFPVFSRAETPDVRKQALARLKRGLPADAVFRCRPEALVVEGRPADAILDTADREDVKLIVMGVQARGAFERLLFGSTTRRVMQAAMCPVLSIRDDRPGGSRSPWPVAAQEGMATATG